MKETIDKSIYEENYGDFAEAPFPWFVCVKCNKIKYKKPYMYIDTSL